MGELGYREALEGSCRRSVSGEVAQCHMVLTKGSFVKYGQD